MKSRGITYLLLAIVVAVWGVVAWKIFHQSPDVSAVAIQPPHTEDTLFGSDEDTLRCDYPDPFLKNEVQRERTKPVIRALPQPIRQLHHEQVQIEHLGSVSSGNKTCYIVLLNEVQYELHFGESATDFVLTSADEDSLYFIKQDVRYGVKCCQ